MYAQGNVLVSKFRKYTSEVKSQLFKTFITNLYCGQLWCNFNKQSFNKLKISYNNVFRFLMGARTKQGVSQLFVHCKVNCFDVTFKNVINCFTKRITKSCNENVSAIISTVFFLLGSSLPANWKKHVYTSQ